MHHYQVLERSLVMKKLIYLLLLFPTLLFGFSWSLLGEYHHSGWSYSLNTYINYAKVFNSGTIRALWSAEIHASEYFDNSNGNIKAGDLIIVAPNIESPQDKEMGLVCWKNSFILNGKNVNYHDPRCNS